MKIQATTGTVFVHQRPATAIAFALMLVVGSGAAAPIGVTDASGAKVELAAPAQRIVSLAPHATELLFAAGAGSHVIGVIASADWPAEAAAVPRVGDARAIDLERLGALAGTRESALRAATAFRARLAALRARERGLPRVRVFYEIWHLPLYTIGGAHLISAAIDLCGGENVFATLRLPAPSVSVESVLAAAPEAIVAGTDGAVRPTWLDAWEPWRSIPAVARGNLFVVDANLLHRAGPRFIDGVEELCSALDLARINLRR